MTLASVRIAAVPEQICRAELPTMSEFADAHPLERDVLAQQWFYRYTLPSGRVTDIYVTDEVEHIHQTRRDMMMAELAPLFAANPGSLTAIDVASHQGWFSLELASRCWASNTNRGTSPARSSSRSAWA
jgi:hypothetical protein